MTCKSASQMPVFRACSLPALAVLAIFILAAASPAPPSSVSLDNVNAVVERRPFFTEPPSVCRIVGNTSISEDLTRWACTIEKDGKRAVVVDGVEGRLFDKAGAWTEPYEFPRTDGMACEVSYDVEFSPDSAHYAYVAQNVGKYFVVFDGAPGPEYDEVGFADDRMPGMEHMTFQYYQRFAFSDDGRTFAYSARKGDKWVVVINGVESPDYDTISGFRGIRPPVFSPDGKHMAYIASREGKVFAVIDGVEGAPFDDVPSQRLQFTADSSRVTYVAREKDSWFVIIDGSAGSPYDEIAAAGVFFGPDSSHFAYAARKGQKWCVVYDGVEGAMYDSVDLRCFSLTDSGASYVAQRAGKCFVVHDKVEGSHHDNLYVFAYGNDGEPLVYWAKDGRSAVVIDHGEERPGYDGVAYFYDGTKGHSRYGLRRGKQLCLVSDGVESPWYDDIRSARVSPDGSRLACEAKKGDNWCMVVDGVEYTPARTVYGFQFSPDSRHFFYIASDPVMATDVSPKVTAGKSSPSPSHRADAVLDGRTIGQYDSIVGPGAVYTADGNHFVLTAERRDQYFVCIDGRKELNVRYWITFRAQSDGSLISQERQPDGQWQIVTIRFTNTP